MSWGDTLKSISRVTHAAHPTRSCRRTLAFSSYNVRHVGPGVLSPASSRASRWLFHWLLIVVANCSCNFTVAIGPVWSGHVSSLGVMRGHAMAQVVSCWPLTVKTRVWGLVISCGLCGGQSSSRTGFSVSSLVYLVNIILPGFHTPITW
jgi:hypothetical protein